MGSLAKMVLDDPSSFNLLTDDIKEKIITAATNTVNMQARMAQKLARENIQKNFTLRNNHTLKQVQFTQCPLGAKSLSEVQSVVGATEKATYLERQEMGGKHEAFSGRNLAIPTLQARGGNMGAVVQKQFRVSNLSNMKVRGEFARTTKEVTSRSGRKFTKEVAVGTHKSRQVARAAVAFRERKLIHYGENLFFVDDFQARDGHVSFTKRELYNFDRPFTVTQSAPWLLPAVDTIAREGAGIFASQMRKAGL